MAFQYFNQGSKQAAARKRWMRERTESLAPEKTAVNLLEHGQVLAHSHRFIVRYRGMAVKFLFTGSERTVWQCVADDDATLFDSVTAANQMAREHHISHFAIVAASRDTTQTKETQ